MHPFSERCACGRTFSQIYGLANHKRGCEKSKKRLSVALSKAKEVWAVRKRARVEGAELAESQQLVSESSSDVGQDHDEVCRQ
jgi:histidinol-phosphate/aromatic aminotransferase/cobyric acid decarboxylase-like protein